MRIIKTDKMPRSNGHYSMCIEHNGFLFISGQLPIEGENKTIPETIEDQTLLVLNKLKLILEEAGSDIKHVIQLRVYLSNIEMWDKVNVVYAEFFGDHKPVRAVVPTGELHYGCLIEIEAVAAVN